MDKLSSEDKLERERSSLTGLNFLVEQGGLKLNAESIREESEKDEIISRVIKLVHDGWPVQDKELKVVENGCLLLGERVVIPPNMRIQALNLLHKNHRVIVKMKQLARYFFYLPGITVDIENYERSCKVCQVTTTPTVAKTYGKWPEASSPFERVHIDFFHKLGRTYLILVDAFSRWTEVKRMTDTTAPKVMHELDTIFATFGFARSIVSDNGPPFRSQAFKVYCEERNREHILTPAYHPQSNGLAERGVGSTKAALTKIIHEKGSLTHSQVDDYIKLLLHHRHQTPTTDGIVPNQKIFGYKLRTEMTEVAKPKAEIFKTSQNNANELNELQEQENELPARIRFQLNEEVIFSRRVQGKEIKLRAKIVRQKSDLVYLVTHQGVTTTAHFNQLKKIPQQPFTLRNHSSTRTPVATRTNQPANDFPEVEEEVVEAVDQQELPIEEEIEETVEKQGQSRRGIHQRKSKPKPGSLNLRSMFDFVWKKP